MIPGTKLSGPITMEWNIRERTPREQTKQSKITTPGQSEINTLKSSQSFKDKECKKMEREKFYHWGATREILDIIKRRNNSLQTKRLVEQRNALSRLGTLRRWYTK